MVGMDSVVVALAIHAAAGSPGAAASFTTPTFLASLPCPGTEGANSEIYSVRSDGMLRQFGESMGAFGQMHNPIYPCTTPEGTLLVSDAQNHRVVEFDPGGTPIRAWGGPGTAPGLFAGPRGIAMDGAGDILVVDEGNKRVQVFSRTGVYLRQWPVRAAGYEYFQPVPRGIAVDNLGRIYVTDRTNAEVRAFQSDGTEIGTWGGSGTDPGHLYGPNAVDLDPQARIYVGESYCHVQVFGRDGATALPRVSWGRLKARYR